MAEVIQLPDVRPGAMPDDWAHFDMVLGLAEDLLPVVSNPRATISPDSNMGGVGKTPSIYNARHQVAGLPQWTQRHSTAEQLAGWAKEKDYGLCLQTRRMRAIDVDVPDPDQANAIRAFIAARFALPARTRANSSKFLLTFEYSGELYKRKFKTEHGIVELLATGQQFIACGTHTSGVRYEWADGLPDSIPVLTGEQVEQLWSDLASRFAVEAPSSSSASTKPQKLAEVMTLDPIARHLLDHQLVKRAERDGRLHITCPWEEEHTSDSGDSSTTYWPAHTGGYENGHFKCLHAHCEQREDHEFLEALGYVDEELLTEFEAIADTIGEAPTAIEAVPERFKFKVENAHEFSQRPAPTWIIKGVLPQAELGVLFGESGSGKSFFALDMGVAVAQGTDWRGFKTRPGRVVYVAAEGAGGFRNRLKAHAHQHGLDLRELNIGIIAGAPNLKDKADALDVAKSIQASGGADLVIIDTFAQTMPGSNENSGEDVGQALAHCKGISRALKGAMVMLVHHSGKDSSKGARGWSGLRAAADVEIEVIRADDSRVATISKQKDGQDGAEFGFKLHTVVVDLDEDGEEITSCIVEHTGTTARDVRRDKGPKGGIQRLVMDQLNDLIGVGDPMVTLHDLKAAVINQIPFDPNEGKRDTRNQRVLSALESLQEAGRILVQGLNISLVNA